MDLNWFYWKSIFIFGTMKEVGIIGLGGIQR